MTAATGICAAASVTLDSQRSHFSFWTAPTTDVAYGLAVLAVVCFVAAIRELPFPGARRPQPTPSSLATPRRPDGILEAIRTHSATAALRRAVQPQGVPAPDDYLAGRLRGALSFLPQDGSPFDIFTVAQALIRAPHEHSAYEPLGTQAVGRAVDLLERTGEIIRVNPAKMQWRLPPMGAPE
jgi:hypothetical protein